MATEETCQASVRLFFYLCSHTMRRGLQFCRSFCWAWLGCLTFLVGVEGTLVLRKRAGPTISFDFSWIWGGVEIQGQSFLFHMSLYPTGWSTFHKWRNFFHNFTLTYFNSLMDDTFVVLLHQINFDLCWIKILNSNSWTLMYNRLWRVEEQSKQMSWR